MVGKGLTLDRHKMARLVRLPHDDRLQGKLDLKLFARDFLAVEQIGGNVLELGRGHVQLTLEDCLAFHAKTPLLRVRCPQVCAFTLGVMDRVSKVVPVRCHRLSPQPATSVSQPSGKHATINTREWPGHGVPPSRGLANRIQLRITQGTSRPWKL